MPTEKLTAPERAERRRQMIETRAVRSFMEWLEEPNTNVGRRTADQIERRLAVIDETYWRVDALARLGFAQERIDLAADTERLTTGKGSRRDKVEAGFIRHGRSWAIRKGITYRAFRLCGVPAATLRKAKITRASP